MSPTMQQILEAKDARRKRLMNLSYPEKVRIVEQMRRTAIEIKTAVRRRSITEEAGSEYRKDAQSSHILEAENFNTQN